MWRRFGVLCLLGSVWPGTVSAEITVIYRKADQVIAGYVYPGQPYETELQNVLQSELGGRAEDYATTTIARLSPDHVLTIQPDGTPKETPVPKDTEREIPLADFAGAAGGVAGAASLVVLVRRKKAGT